MPERCPICGDEFDILNRPVGCFGCGAWCCRDCWQGEGDYCSPEGCDVTAREYGLLPAATDTEAA